MNSQETVWQILESLQPYPQMHFLLFAKEWGEREETLLKFCEERDHSILLYQFPDLREAELPSSPRIRQRPYRREQARYNLQGRLYNHAFVTAEPPEPAAQFARKVYTGIANAGGLYLFLKKKKVDAWKNLLQESNYVALSTIDLADTETIVLYARKMHGWGG